MSLSTFHFRPGWLSTLLIIGVMLPLFTSLGIWQIARAEEKRSLTDRMETRRALPPIILNRVKISADQSEFRSFTVTGEFVPTGQILIANRKYLGKPGFHVITPLQLRDSQHLLLVNRGWVAATQNQPPEIPTPEGQVTLTGEANIPSAPAIELNFDLEASTVWPFITLDNYRSWSKEALAPFMLLLSADSPHGFVREWRSARPGPGMHLGYAIQWFAFALLSGALWLRLSVSRREPRLSGVCT